MMRVLVFILALVMFCDEGVCDESATPGDIKSERVIVTANSETNNFPGEEISVASVAGALINDKDVAELEIKLNSCRKEVETGEYAEMFQSYDDAIACAKNIAYQLFDTYYKDHNKEVKATFDEYVKVAKKISFNIHLESDWGQHFAVTDDTLYAVTNFWVMVRDLVSEYINEIKFQNEDMHKALDDEGAQKLMTDISKLQGKDIVYSSPYKRGNEAERFTIQSISFGDDYADNGELVINGKSYFIDQLFIKNADDKHENLVSYLNYNGLRSSYFLKYYDEKRLGIIEEVALLKEKTKNCVKNYEGSGSGTVAYENEQFGKCLDDVFYRVVDTFYTNSADKMKELYQNRFSAEANLYQAVAEPDDCYGRCGTVSFMQAVGKGVDAKQQFILDVLTSIEQDIKAKN